LRKHCPLLEALALHDLEETDNDFIGYLWPDYPQRIDNVDFQEDDGDDDSDDPDPSIPLV